MTLCIVVHLAAFGKGQVALLNALSQQLNEAKSEIEYLKTRNPIVAKSYERYYQEKFADEWQENKRLMEALLKAQHGLITSDGLWCCDNKEGHSLFRLDNSVEIKAIKQALKETK